MTKIFNNAALAHMMLSSDTIANEIETILNGQEIFGDLVMAGGGAVPATALLDETTSLPLLDETTSVILIEE